METIVPINTLLEPYWNHSRGWLRGAEKGTSVHVDSGSRQQTPINLPAVLIGSINLD